MSIARLAQLAWQRRWLFLAVTVLSAAAIIAYAFLATPSYRVAVKLMPRQGESPAGGLQSLLGQFGGMAALMGLGAPVDEQEALAWLKSRSLAESFIVQENLMPVLFAKQWDPATKQWRKDLEREPTMDDAWQFFDRRLRRVNQDTKTKMITLDINWKDRYQAVAWANGLVKLANEQLRQRALYESDATLKSLQEQLEETETLELRQSIYRLTEVQVNRKVLAKSRPDYAFAVLDPAAVPDKHRFTSPRRMLLVLVSIPFGLFAACCVVLALNFMSTMRGFWSSGLR
ncbi:MAG TPA: Wzz/FepE/Etk N-terminal domain-containing protein [Steroidobacter sp.]|uniref:Wzz/FepE/Etk N-terminal domain-containing protein n=1 Tax=Steroidobacter sp. TaxID=1978227 RepID=UPI002ED8B8B6